MFILPTSENIFVPLLPSVPISENHFALFRIICGTFAQVSTLLIFVGFLKRPFCTGYGGRCFGTPTLPSIAASNDVSSPETKAPAPRTTSIEKLNPVPNISLPSNPYFSAWSIAIFNLFKAKGYSVRTYI